MCNKIAMRIECESCGYPYSEALWPDNYDDPIPCDATTLALAAHINDVKILMGTRESHPYDCKCLVCR